MRSDHITYNGVGVLLVAPDDVRVIITDDDDAPAVSFTSTADAAYALAFVQSGNEADYFIGAMLAVLFPADTNALEGGFQGIIDGVDAPRDVRTLEDAVKYRATIETTRDSV